MFTIHKIKEMNSFKDTKKRKAVRDFWPELIKQEQDFLLFLFFPSNDYGHKPDLEKFKSVDLHKIETIIKEELKHDNEILRDCLLRLILSKIQITKSK